MSDPIDACVERWHQHLRGELDGGLDALLHPECVFMSPIVFTPQRGRDITKLYLEAAGSVLGDFPTSPGPFRYVAEIRRGHRAVLEFETTIAVDGDDRYANGVDIITCDDDARIVEFTVMLRPLQAINAIHAHMRAMLEQLTG